MFRFPSPDRPIFFGKVKKKNKKISRITCKEASTLIYKHTILSSKLLNTGIDGGNDSRTVASAAVR